MRTYGLRWGHWVFALSLFGLACNGDSTSSDGSNATETGDGDGEPGDGDGEPGDGDGEPGDGDGEPGDGDGEPGDGDGEPGDGDGEPGDGDGDGDGDPGDGDGDGDPGDGDGDPGDGDGDPGDGDGDGDTGGDLTCDEIELAFDALVDDMAACETDDQCQVVFGHCEIGLGGCWYVVNDSISQAEIDALADQFQGQGCFGPICLCLPPPAGVACIDNLCQPT